MRRCCFTPWKRHWKSRAVIGCVECIKMTPIRHLETCLLRVDRMSAYDIFTLQSKVMSCRCDTSRYEIGFESGAHRMDGIHDQRLFISDDCCLSFLKTCASTEPAVRMSMAFIRIEQLLHSSHQATRHAVKQLSVQSVPNDIVRQSLLLEVK